MKALRKQLETIFFKVGLTLLPRLNRTQLLRLARFGSFLGYLFSPSLRKVGKANLDIVYGDSKSSEEKTALLKKSFRVFVTTMLDTVWFTRDTEARFKRYVTYTPEMEAMLANKPLVCVTAHFGNWEVLGLLTALKGAPLSSVYKPLKNPKVDVLFRQMRTHTGQKIIETGGAYRKLVKELKSGNRIGLVIDQNIREHQGGVFYPFFGLPALVSTAPASLSIRSGTDLFATFCRLNTDGSYEAFSPTGPIPVKKYQAMGEAGIDACTKDLLQIMQQVILKEPEYWLWMYKRWKYIPEGAAECNYPYYAKR